MSEINDIFEADPLHLTQPDIRKVIEYYRKIRVDHLETGKPVASGKPPPSLSDLQL